MSTWFVARCPTCANTTVVRCRRRGLAYVLARACLFKAFRCEPCDRRFYVFASRQVDAPR